VTALRVLRVYHSAVVDEYRERERHLRSAFGHDVHLVCPPRWSEGGTVVEARPGGDLPVHIVDVRGRAHPILFWYAQRPFRRLLRELRPDVVDLHEEPYSLAVSAALRAVRAEVPHARVCVYTAQNILKRYPPPIRQLEDRALRRADACYPCSTEAGGVLRGKGYDGPLHVIPLGVSIPAQPKVHADGPAVVGFLGRLESYKGAHVAVRALAVARAAGADARLEILGAGPQEGELRALAVELGIAGHVELGGAVPQDEALRRIATYDAVLIPSLTVSNWKEQFGRVAAQAMAAGVPVLASDTGSLPEVVADPALLAPEGDAEAFGRRLFELVTRPADRARLGERGRERAQELFGWPEVAADFDRMYRRVVDGDARDWSYAAVADRSMATDGR
jgi:glycosyltransferase involved in cell wall biosynthesis